MRPLELIKTAEHLLKVSNHRPVQENLKRAQSTLYYALFHCLAHECANGFIGGASSQRSNSAWTQTYRALDHRMLKDRCTTKKSKKVLLKFSPEIQRFADNFVGLQEKRHRADYDPDFRLSKSDVVADIELAKLLITDLQTAALKDKRAFCSFALFNIRD